MPDGTANPPERAVALEDLVTEAMRRRARGALDEVLYSDDLADVTTDIDYDDIERIVNAALEGALVRMLVRRDYNTAAELDILRARLADAEALLDECRSDQNTPMHLVHAIDRHREDNDG